jgi:PP-loop superfamily ATP-utilizing enzyme
VLPQAMSHLLAQTPQVVQALSALGFDHITMDLRGFRSGSMDADLESEDLR